MNGYDSVFANAKDEELEFEVMFDQEDDLIDTIVGCNENGDPLTGAEPCPAATAEERSDNESNPDYEKDIDAADSKDAPKDAEGTVGYDFEDEPEIKGEVDDQTKPEAEPVEGEDEYQEKDNSDKGVEDTVTGTIENDKDVLEAYFAETEDELSGADTNSATNAKERSCDDCNPDYEKDVDASDTKNAPKDAEGTVGYDFEEKPELAGKVDDQTNVDPKDVKIDEEVDYDITIPKDAEGTVGYDFEVNPEIGSKDDQTNVDSKDVKVEEEVDYDMPDLPPEGTEKTTPAGPTDIETDCGDVAGATNAVVGYDFENEAAEEPEVEKIDKDVEAIEDPENYLDDDAIDDVESGDPKTKLDYDISDEDIIDYAINNK